MRALQVEHLGNRLEQEARAERLQLRRQTLAVVREPDDVAHDAIGLLAPERLDEPGVVAADAIGRAGEVERDDAHAVGLEPRAELHRLPRADDAVGARDHERAARARGAEYLIDERSRIGRQRAVPERRRHAAEPERLERRRPHRFDLGGGVDRHRLSSP
jgi:hypothetical protein